MTEEIDDNIFQVFSLYYNVSLLGHQLFCLIFTILQYFDWTYHSLLHVHCSQSGCTTYVKLFGLTPPSPNSQCIHSHTHMHSNMHVNYVLNVSFANRLNFKLYQNTYQLIMMVTFWCYAPKVLFIATQIHNYSKYKSWLVKEFVHEEKTVKYWSGESVYNVNMIVFLD